MPFLQFHVGCDNFLNFFTEYLISIFRVTTTRILRRYYFEGKHYVTGIAELGLQPI